jgi:anaphase-promoting complex subunit 10
VSQLCFYLDYNLDESYTAKKVSIRCGTTVHDLVDLTALELHEPIGWVTINLSDHLTGGPLRTHMLQLRILSMHQNGRYVATKFYNFVFIISFFLQYTHTSYFRTV